MSIFESAKRTLFWITDMLHGGKITKPYNDIKYILSDSVKGKQRQQEHLQRLLKHACSYSMFYKDYACMPIDRFPVVNKLILKENYNNVLVPTEHIPGQIGNKIHIQKTSGSTGVPFAIHQDTLKRYRRIAALKYFGFLAGFKTHDMLIQCDIWSGCEKSKFRSFTENIIPIDVPVMDDKTMDKICYAMHKYKAKAVMMYGSWGEAFSTYLERKPQKFKHLKVLITGAEMLKSSARRTLRTLLNCDVIERYANEEAGVLAQQRFNSDCYYLNHGNYYFELLKLDSDEKAEYGEIGRIVITDLFNYAFPLIRYDTGDIGIMSPPDKYSNGYPVLSKLYGRNMDITYNNDGAPIHPLAYIAIEPHLSCTSWQIVQTDKKSFELRICRCNGSYTADNSKIYEIMHKITGNDTDFKIVDVNSLTEFQSKKKKFVLNEWNKG